MPKDLRYFLSELARQSPRDFFKVDRRVDPKFELTSVLRKLQQAGRYPAVLFNQVKGSEFPVVANLFAHPNLLGLAFGCNPQHLVEGYLGLEARVLRSKTVRKARVHENVYLQPRVDLGLLPSIIHCEKDAGPYFTSAVGVFKDPDTGVYDLGIFRMQIKGRDKLVVSYGGYSKAARIIKKNEDRNKPTETAVFIGHHPAAVLTSQVKVPAHVDEFAVMGGLLGEPVALVQAKTVDIRVPAFAEFVIEGEILPSVREAEAPFGEFAGYYGPERPGHVMRVSAITHRNDAIFHTIFNAHADHRMAGKVQREAAVFKRTKAAVSGIKAVWLPESGACRHMAYVSMHKEYDGQGKIAALAALAADPMMKLAVIVDDDIDVTNETEVWWAVATRTQADRAIVVIPEAFVTELEPAAHSIKGRQIPGNLNAKWAIDTTRPIGLPFEQRADVPYDVWSNIKLDEYLR